MCGTVACSKVGGVLSALLGGPDVGVGLPWAHFWRHSPCAWSRLNLCQGKKKNDRVYSGRPHPRRALRAQIKRRAAKRKEKRSECVYLDKRVEMWLGSFSHPAPPFYTAHDRH